MNLDRRSFLKASLVSVAAVAAASAAAAKETFAPLTAEAAEIIAPIRETAEFPYQVDPKYQRLPAEKLAYLRMFDPEENKGPIKFHFDDVSKITGKKDTGKDLPCLTPNLSALKGVRRPLVKQEPFSSPIMTAASYPCAKRKWGGAPWIWPWW
uniref:Uncharacterized protein n=1 Tax=Desulfitobacterium hafniense TaxID=49338 RepID=Q8RPF4_DESHA|nr:unknown [Desulfitobacterium hafniense DCB-2]